MSVRREAFMKGFGEQWMVVIVKRVAGTTGEVETFKMCPSKEAADAWRIEQIGDGEVIFDRHVIN